MSNGDYYDDLDEFMVFEEINEMRGTIKKTDCIYCGSINTMKYEGGVCFICSKCKMGADEDIVYRKLLGYDMEEDPWT